VSHQPKDSDLFKRFDGTRHHFTTHMHLIVCQRSRKQHNYVFGSLFCLAIRKGSRDISRMQTSYNLKIMPTLLFPEWNLFHPPALQPGSSASSSLSSSWIGMTVTLGRILLPISDLETLFSATNSVMGETGGSCFREMDGVLGISAGNSFTSRGGRSPNRRCRRC